MLDVYSPRRGYVVTPNDGVSLSNKPRFIYVGTGGDVTVLLVDDTATVTFKNVPSGTLLPIRPRRIMATGTTAINMIALY